MLSLGTFEKAGYKFVSENGRLFIKAGDQVLLSGDRYDTLYLLKWRLATRDSLAAQGRSDDTVMWHRRLCHMSQKNMNLLVKKDLLDKKKVSVLDSCEDYIYGRAKHVGFALAQHDTKEKLEYVHSDLWGAPSVPMSLSRCQYFISFIDTIHVRYGFTFSKSKMKRLRSSLNGLTWWII